MQHNKKLDEAGCYYAAVDIGTSKIVILVGKQNDDKKIDIIAESIVPSKGVVKGDIRNTNEVVAGITSAVEKIEKEYGIKILETYVGLSGQHIKFMQKDGYVSINNKEGEVTSDDVIRLSKEMNNITIPPGEAIIHILPQSYCIDDDSDVIEPVGMVGNRLNGIFNIVTGNNDKLMLTKRCLNRSKIDMKTIILSSLASAEAVLIDDAKELGVVVVDMGGGTTDVAIYHDKTMRFLGVIPIGGELINKDIRAMGVLERLVEKLKVKFGSAFSDDVADNQVIRLQSPSGEISQKDLAMVIEARIMDIIESLEKMIDNAGYRGKLKGGIVITGGGAQIKGIDKLFARHFKCAVSIAKAGMYISNESKEIVDSPEYSTAVGLLLRAALIGNPSKLEFLIPQEAPEQPVVVPQPAKPYTPQTSNTNQQYGSNTNNYGATPQRTQPATTAKPVTPPAPVVPEKKPDITQFEDTSNESNNDTDYDDLGKVSFWQKVRRFIEPDNDDLEDNKIK
ncbi:MAG: cell division protein FtsA [Rikenellaceae bacterium]